MYGLETIVALNAQRQARDDAARAAKLRAERHPACTRRDTPMSLQHGMGERPPTSDLNDVGSLIAFTFVLAILGYVLGIALAVL